MVPQRMRCRFRQRGCHRGAETRPDGTFDRTLRFDGDPGPPTSGSSSASTASARPRPSASSPARAPAPAARCSWPRGTPSGPRRPSSSPSGRSAPASEIVRGAEGGDPERGGLRRRAAGLGAGQRSRPRRHRRSAPHQGQPGRGAQEDPPGGRPAPGQGHRGAARPRRHDRAERRSPRPASSSTPSGSPGVVLTKLDGTAKGGIVIAIQRELGPARQARRARRGSGRPGALRPRGLRRRPARLTIDPRSSCGLGPESGPVA